MDMKACRDSRYKRSKQCYCILSRVSCLSTLSIWRSKHTMYLMLCLLTLSTLVLRLLHNTLYRVLWGVKTLHKVASHPCQEGRLLCEPSVLDLTTTRVMHSRSPIHKSKGALSNVVIVMFIERFVHFLHFWAYVSRTSVLVFSGMLD